MEYYVNYNTTTNPGLHHEVHSEGCPRLPTEKMYLGEYSSCYPAVRKAKETYVDADGCKICCEECHTG